MGWKGTLRERVGTLREQFMRDSPKATATYRSICGTTSSRLAADVAPPAPAADVASNAAPSANVPCNAAPSANVEPKAPGLPNPYLC